MDVQGPMDIQEHWHRLGIALTTDPAEIRRAYARRLRTVNPESDPDGFQALRHSLETLMSLQSHTPAAATDQQAEALGLAGAFERQLAALRHAGNTQAAIALVDRLFANHPPGHPVITAVDTLLFRGTALERTRSPGLFMHLVARFDWRDASGPAAQADPQRHSVLLARVAAEDWYSALVADAARPGAVVQATVLARNLQAILPPGALDKDQKEAARVLMAALLDMGQFLLDRFDARSLAILREAVEGPPLLATEPAPAVPPSPAVPAAAPVTRTRRALQRIIIGATITVLVAVGAASIILGNHSVTVEPAPEVRARQLLDQTTDAWVSLRPFGGQTLVYFTQLVTSRTALASVRYGLDTAVPNREFPLPPNANAWPQIIGEQTETYVTAPANLRYVSVQLTYADGSTSPVHITRRAAGP